MPLNNTVKLYYSKLLLKSGIFTPQIAAAAMIAEVVLFKPIYSESYLQIVGRSKEAIRLKLPWLIRLLVKEVYARQLPNHLCYQRVMIMDGGACM